MNAVSDIAGYRFTPRIGAQLTVVPARARDRDAAFKVVALALKLGATVPAFITRATLANALAVAANPLTRQRLINATHQLSRWDALDCLLDGIDQDPHASDVLRALVAWGNEAGRRFAPLSADRKRTCCSVSMR